MVYLNMSSDSDCPELTSASSDDDISPDDDGNVICSYKSDKFGTQVRKWMNGQKIHRLRHDRVIKIYTLAPFLYGQATWPDKWLRFAHSVGLLPSDGEFKVDTLNKEQLKNVELVENALDLLLPILWEDQVTLAVALSTIEMCGSQDTLHDLTTCALKNTQIVAWLKRFHNNRVNSDKSIMALLIGLRQYVEHVVKYSDEGIDMAKEFEAMVEEEDKHVEETKKHGNEEYRKCNYLKATSIYQRAMYMSSYNHILYGNRAQAYLKLGNHDAARSDGKRSVTLKPEWDKGWQRYKEACKNLGGALPADLELWEEREKKEHMKNKNLCNSNGLTRQSSIEDSDTSAIHTSSVKHRESKTNVHSQGSSEEKQFSGFKFTPSTTNTKTTQANGTKQPPNSQNFDQTADKNSGSRKNAASVAKSRQATSTATKTKNKMRSAWQKHGGDDETKNTFHSYMIEGSTALCSQSSRKALHYFREALDLVIKNETKFYDLDPEKLVVLKYSIGSACVSTRDDQEILTGIAVFEEIQNMHKSVQFPLVFLGLGRAFFTQNRFPEALQPLQKGLCVVKKLAVTGVFCWPGTQTIIEESKPGRLQVELQTLVDRCLQPPLPDAICRYNNCHGHYKLHIYFSDPDFKGFVRVTCFAKCNVEYHIDCWKKERSLLEERWSEKDILNGPCFTPDCNAAVWTIIIYNETGSIQKEWAAPAPEKKDKKSSADKMKPSSMSTIEKRRMRKQVRKQRKKEQKASKEEPEDAVEEHKAGNNQADHNKENSNPHEGCSTEARASSPSQLPTNFATVLKKDGSSEDDMYKGITQSNKSKSRRRKDKKKTINLVEFVGEGSIGDDHGVHKGSTGLHDNISQRPVQIGTSTGLDDFDLPVIHRSQFPALDPHHPFSVPQSLRDDVDAFEHTLPTGFGQIDRSVPDLASPEPLSSGLNVGQVEPLEEEEDPRISGIKETIFSFFLGILQEHGPLHVEDIVIQRELSEFPAEAQEIIRKAGGIGRFLIQSLQFAMIEDFVCLMPDAVKARHLASNRNKELRELYQSKAGGLDTRGQDRTRPSPPNFTSPSQFPSVGEVARQQAVKLEPAVIELPSHQGVELNRSESLTLSSIASTVMIPGSPSRSTDSHIAMGNHTMTVNSPSPTRSSPTKFRNGLSVQATSNHLLTGQSSNVTSDNAHINVTQVSGEGHQEILEFPSAYDVKPVDLNTLSHVVPDSGISADHKVDEPHGKTDESSRQDPSKTLSYPSSPERLSYTRGFNTAHVGNAGDPSKVTAWPTSQASLWNAAWTISGHNPGHQSRYQQEFMKVDEQEGRAADSVVSPDHEPEDSPVVKAGVQNASSYPSRASSVDSNLSAADRYGPIGSRPNSTDTTRTNSPLTAPGMRPGLPLRPGLPYGSANPYSLDLPPASSLNWNDPLPVSINSFPHYGESPGTLSDVDRSAQDVIQQCDQEYARELAESIKKIVHKYPSLASDPNLMQNLMSDITNDFQASREQAGGTSITRPPPPGLHGWNFTVPVIPSRPVQPYQNPPSPIITRDSGTNTDVFESEVAVIQQLGMEKHILQQQLQEMQEKNMMLGNMVNTQLQQFKREHHDQVDRYQKLEALHLESSRRHKSEAEQWLQERHSLQEEVKTLKLALTSTKNAHESVVLQLSEKDQSLAQLKETVQAESTKLNEQICHLQENLEMIQKQWLSEKKRSQDAEVALLHLKSDVGKQILERSLKDAEMYAVQMGQAMKNHNENKQAIPPQLKSLYDNWRVTADRIKALLNQSKAAFEDQIQQVQQGTPLNQLPVLQIPRPPPPPETPMKASLMRGGMPAVFSKVVSKATGGPTLTRGTGGATAPPPGMGQATKPASSSTTATIAQSGRVTTPSRLGQTASTCQDQQGFTEVRSHKQAKNSFDKIMEFLTRMFPTYKQPEINQFIQDLRHSRNGSLSGMALDDIVQNVAELIHQDQRRKLKQSGMNISQVGLVKSVSNIDIFEEEEDPCIICHDEMVPENTITLECQHRFHSECIRKWLKEQSTCPTCRIHALLPDEFPSLG